MRTGLTVGDNRADFAAGSPRPSAGRRRGYRGDAKTRLGKLRELV